MKRVRILGLIAVLLAFMVSFATAQRIPRQPFPPEPPADSEQTQQQIEIQRKLQRERLTKRSQDIKRDSEKLLELATELKAYVDKAGENVLSLEVVRKAEEMEKLARQVKNNMRAQ